jgi:hypothetical protein
MLEIINIALAFIVSGVLCLILIAFAYAFIYAFYILAGFWGAFGAFLFCVFVQRAAAKKSKEEDKEIEYKIEHGIQPSYEKSEGFHATDFALGWMFSRLFK